MELRHEEREHRFVGEVEGARAVLDYRPLGEGVVDYHHTYVPPALRGRGAGARLVRFALDHARASGLRVVPSCWFVARVIDADDEYADLVAAR